MHLDKFRLDGKVALVLGAGAGGIGTQTSVALAEAGATVVAVDRTDELVQETVQRLASLNSRCIGFTANLLDTGAVKKAVAAAITEAGRIDCLANVAGGMQRGQWYRLEECPDDVFDAIVNLNFRYVFTACREAGKHMIERGIKGRIVSFASITGTGSTPYHGPYGASKAAVMALTRTMAVEWGRYGIRVNAVAPGSVRTPRTSWRGSDPDEFAKSRFPLERRLEPDELAAVAAFLLSDAASGITGQTIIVDNGASVQFLGGDRSQLDRSLQPAP